MSENKATLEAVMGFEAGYEKGVRDMWKAIQKHCYELERIITENKKKKEWTIHEFCKPRKRKCTFETCPIAQKLLKGVK